MVLTGEVGILTSIPGIDEEEEGEVYNNEDDILSERTKPVCSFCSATVTEFLEWLTPSSLLTLVPYTSTLSVLLNEQGGIIDDMMITKHVSDMFYIVTNMARRMENLAWFNVWLAE